MLINNTRGEIEDIKKKYKIKVTESFKYLGINIAKNIQDLKTLKFGKLKEEIKEKILGYKTLKLSWFGRVALCKMKILPKFFILDATNKIITGGVKTMAKYYK